VDWLGRLIKVEDYTGTSTLGYTLYGTTTYQYNLLNLLTQVKDTQNNTTTITYDGFGRKTRMVDPDMGDWRYRYDALNNLTAQIDNRRKAVNFYYDGLNRLRGKTFNAGPVNADTYQPPADPGYSGYTVKYYYDAFTAGSNFGKGHRTSMVDAIGTTTWTYNALGQMKDETHTIGSATYKMCDTYDAFGRILTQTYPSTSNCTGEILTYSYNAMGTLEAVATSLGGNYINSIAYTASGQVNETVLGNTIVSQSCYNANTLRITAVRAYPGVVQSCVTTDPANSRLNLKYTQYDSAGNIKQVVDATRSETLNFTYDDLDRLLSVTTTGGSSPYSQSYGYNPIGNLTAKAGVTLSYAAQAGTCPDGALSKPHAVTSAGTDTYCYDKNGNMVKRTESGTTYTQNFDTENRMTSVVTGSQTTTFVYDGDGVLVKKVRPDNTYTLYIGGIYELELNASSVVTKKTSYYPGGAMRVEIVGGLNTVYYLLKDHLGSASVVLDSSGAIIANGEQRYYPYGEKRITTAALPTDRLFTGQLELASLGGIYHYGARMYSPRLGRFLSADTIVPEPKYPQALNRYSYVYNNPLKYVDPTGHETCYDTGLEIGHDISQADCWAYGTDKWIYELPVEAPQAGQGYSLSKIIDGIIDGIMKTITNKESDDDTPWDQMCKDFIPGCMPPTMVLNPGFFIEGHQKDSNPNISGTLFDNAQKESDDGLESSSSSGGGGGKGGRLPKRIGKLIEEYVARKLKALGFQVERSVRVETPFGNRVLDMVAKKDNIKIGIEVKTDYSPYTKSQFLKDYYLKEYKDWKIIVIRVLRKSK
jgi:RHS repeat-associated protein